MEENVVNFNLNRNMSELSKDELLDICSSDYVKEKTKEFDKIITILYKREDRGNVIYMLYSNDTDPNIRSVLENVKQVEWAKLITDSITEAEE